MILPLLLGGGCPQADRSRGWDGWMSTMDAVQERAQAEYGLDLGHTAIDTVSAACDFNHDDTQQTVAVMNNINRLKYTLNSRFGSPIILGRVAGWRHKRQHCKRRPFRSVLYCYETKEALNLCKKIRLFQIALVTYLHP